MQDARKESTEAMAVKKTQLLAAELEAISDTLCSNYCREVLREAAERLTDLEKIGEFYQRELTRLQEKIPDEGGKNK